MIYASVRKNNYTKNCLQKSKRGSFKKAIVQLAEEDNKFLFKYLIKYYIKNNNLYQMPKDLES